MQQTSATAYDDAGNVTATIDALGRVAATTYNALGQDVGDYQGQALNQSGSWEFDNLAPNSGLSFDVYVYSATPLTGAWQSGYSVSGLVEGIVTSGAATLHAGMLDPAAPRWTTAGTIWGRFRSFRPPRPG